MAYGLKYWFEFDDYYDRTCKIELYLDSYASTVYEIESLGSNPVVISRNGDDDKFKTIIGSECAINIISETDFQWDEFFDITYREWYVKYYISASIFWEGYLIPDMYQEPYIDPPYNVILRATDQLADLDQSEYLDSGEPYTGQKSLSVIIGECLTYAGLNFGASLHFLASFNIYEENNTTGANNDPLELQKVDVAWLYDEVGTSNVYDILDWILAAINCRVYQNAGFFELMHIPQLAAASFAYRDFGAAGGVSSNGTINNHQVTITLPSVSNTNVWVENSMMLSVFPPLLQSIVKHNYNYRENLVRNPDFKQELILSDQPFYWVTAYDISDGEYRISNGKLIIEKYTAAYYTLMYQTLGTIETADNKLQLNLDVKTSGGSCAILIQIGSGGAARYLLSTGAWTSTLTRMEFTTDTVVSILSDTITAVGELSIIIYSLKASGASYAVFSGFKCEIIPDDDKWYPEFKNFIGDGDVDNRLKKEIEMYVGDRAKDFDISNAGIAYDGSLISHYYVGAVLTLSGYSWLWKRTGGTIYNNLLAFTVLDRLANYETPTYKITGKIKSSLLDFRKVLLDGKLSGRYFIQGRMKYNAIESSWEGDWLEIKDEETMPTLTFTLSPTSWNPDQAAQSQVVTVTATAGIVWEAVELTGVAWLSITDPIGSGSGSFTIVVTQNTSGGSRNETVRIKGTGIAYKSLVVTQAPI